ncbi:MAG: hypothetical protein ACREBH_02510 [Candidatus Micrarchaeaceae archaeon]
MGFDSYYNRSDLDNKDGESEKKGLMSISVEEPLAFWIGLIAIGAIMQLLAIPLATSYGHTAFNIYMNQFAGYVIYIPGIVVLPLIVSMWIGDRVSYLDRKKTNVARKGLINAIYAVIVYVVSILILYVIMNYLHAGVLSALSMDMFFKYVVAVPCIIVIVIVPLFAVVSAARRY